MISIPFKLSLGLLVILPIFLSAQVNTLATIKKISYDLDLGFGAYYQFTSFGSTQLNNAKIPTALPRRLNDPALRDTWRLNNNAITDNPSFHGSYFFRLGAKFKLGESLSVTAAVNAEQRGFSDCVFSNNTINFHPYFNAIYKKEIGDFSCLLQIGDFWDFKLYEGLTFYNLETQSWLLKLKYKNFYFKHAGVGDLLIGIGLAIDDVYDYAVGIENIVLNEEKELELDAGLGYSNNRQSQGGGFWNLSGSLNLKKDHSLYTQISMNTNAAAAMLIGLRSEFELFEHLKFQLVGEFRRYSTDFLLGYFSEGVYYRQQNRGATFTNSTNNVFIPLDYYERNFNQWAIYTEYQNVDISGVNLQIDLRYPISETLFLETQLDFNWLMQENSTFLFPLYQIAFGIAPSQNSEIAFEVNNKVLNLDKSFPSFYASNDPYLLMRLYKPLRFIKENDQHHRL